MSNLHQCANQWASRPADQRYTSLTEMAEKARRIKETSESRVLSTRDLIAVPGESAGISDPYGERLVLQSSNGEQTAPTHWAFGQLATRAGAPAGYLRNIPAPLAADCINYGLQQRDVEEIGMLTHNADGVRVAAAVTGPNYGRIWNSTILNAVVRRFGDGINGKFRVPGEFGQRVEVTKENTTLYMGDRDFFIFLADEENRIEFPGERRKTAWNGTDIRAGLARGFFLWNSETGAQTFGVAQFLFDYACSNRIVWGAQDYKEIVLRHTKGAPHRFIEDVAPALERMAESSPDEPLALIKSAQQKEIGDKERVADFLAKRFSKSQVAGIAAAHMREEQKPIETLWDAVTGVTAFAKTVDYQNERVAIEREAGKILSLAA